MSAETAPSRDHLVELSVRDLGIIEDARFVVGPGMTALTGETGAGKTLLVGAIELLLGGRADPSMVRNGASQAVVEGRFELGGEEVVLARVVPAVGRSRAYIDGRMATAGALGEAAGSVIDLHGQHEHQSLLSPAVQRDALDRFGDIDLDPLRAARAERARVAAALDGLGGDAGAREREADLLRFQLAELRDAALTGPDEDDHLDREEDRLGDALAHREAAATTARALADEGGALDTLASAIAALDGRAPFVEEIGRLRSIQAELADAASEVRSIAEAIEDDPERLATVRARRQQLVELRRKYAAAPRPDGGGTGDGTLGAVAEFERSAAARLAEIEGHDARAAELDGQALVAERRIAEAAASVARARRAAAPELASAVTANLADLAMPAAKVEVAVGGPDPADEVALLLAANPGVPPGPLARVASGGELARSMLALRLVLSMAPGVLVFDEVDAGIGGEAALAVGRALAALAEGHQVLVVTHLAQVAAFADAQITVSKHERDGRTVAEATLLGPAERVVELSRMLSGTPDSMRVRGAAEELLAHAERERSR